MATSNRTRKAPAPGRRAQRRPACVPAATTCTTPNPAGSEPSRKPPSSGGLKVTIRVTSLPDPESNPLRAQQLAVIVNLLRRAATEAAGRVSDDR